MENKDDDVVPDASEIDKEDKKVSFMLDTSTTWRPDVLFYISGYIVKNKLCMKMRCSECAMALFQPSEEINQVPDAFSLLACKQYGKLSVPSSSLVRVITSTDKFARNQLTRLSGRQVEKSRIKVGFNF